MMDRKGWKFTGTLAQRLLGFLKVVTAILSMEKIGTGAVFLETLLRDLTAKVFLPLKTILNYLR